MNPTTNSMMDRSLDSISSHIDWPAYIDWYPSGDSRTDDPEFDTPLPATNAPLAPAQQAYRPLGTVTATLLESPSPPASADVTETRHPRPRPARDQDEEEIRAARAKISRLESYVLPTSPAVDAVPSPAAHEHDASDIQQLKRKYNELLEKLGPWTQVMNRMMANFVVERCLHLDREDEATIRRWEEHIERMD